MLTIPVYNNNIADACKKLRRKFKKEGFVKDLKRHEYYEKPSARRHKIKSQYKKKSLTQSSPKSKYPLDFWECINEDDNT